MEYWSRWAVSCYGWKYLHLYKNPTMNNFKKAFERGKDTEAVANYLDIKRKDFIKEKWSSELHFPAYFIAIDHKNKNIALAIRGSMSPSDLLTDADIKPLDFKGGRVHGGILKASNMVYRDTKLSIKAIKKEYPDYSFITTGHSLGGAVSAVIAHLFNDDNIDTRAYCYGPPPIFTHNLAKMYNDKILTIVKGDDIVSRLCIGEQLYLPGQIHHIDSDKIIERSKEHFVDKIMTSTMIKNHLPDAYENINKN